MRHILIYTDEDDNWCASCSSLPGCFSQGETREETTKNIKEAIEGYIEALEADGLPVHEETYEMVALDV